MRCTRRSIRSTTTRSSARSTRFAAAIPHGELAIQFDVASAVFARLERNEASSYGRSKAEMQETFSAIVADLGNRVPAGVDLLYHLCYGDSNHRHVVEPTDMGDMVEFANRLSRNIKRPIDLIHMPVPRNRADDAYFDASETAGATARNRTLPGPRPLHRRRRLVRSNAWRRRRNTPTISLSPRNAVSAGATHARFRSCCASTPRSRTCDCFPAQRSTKWCAADPDRSSSVQSDPGSAVHRFATLRAAPHPGNMCFRRSPQQTDCASCRAPRSQSPSRPPH